VTNAALLKKVEEFSARVAALEADNTRLREEKARLHQENRLLRQKLDLYIRHYFGGQRNEGLDKHQLELLLQGLANVITLPTPEPKLVTTSRNGTPHPVRRMLAEDKLETYEIVIEPEEVQAQPEGWRKISEERTSQLDWVAAKIIKRVFIRPRYVKDEQFAIAPLPPQPIEQGMVGPGLLAQILINKYEYHIPLYRQEKMFRQQFGVELSRKTMGVMGGTVAGVVDAGVSGDSGRFAARPLPASRRDADPLFGSGCERQKPTGVSLDLQSARWGCGV
jgi:transposase